MTVMTVQIPKPLTPSLTPSNHPLPIFITHFRFWFSLSTKISKLFPPKHQTLNPKFFNSSQGKSRSHSYLSLHLHQLNQVCIYYPYLFNA